MFEIYSFCRAVDDIADDGGPRPERRAALAQWRKTIEALANGTARARRPRTVSLRRCAAFDLDARGFLRRHRRHGNGCRGRYPGARLHDARSLLRSRRERGRPAFGARLRRAARAKAIDLAHHLGRAFQLTNILRDLDEDAAIEPALSAARSAASGWHHDDAIREACSPIPRSPKPARRSSPWQRSILRTAAAIMARCPRRQRAGAAADGRCLSLHPRPASKRAALRRRARAFACPSIAFSSLCCGMACFKARMVTGRSRRSAHPIACLGGRIFGGCAERRR